MNPAIRLIVRGTYDLQKLRIQTGLRLVASLKQKLGQAPGVSEEELPPEAQAMLKDLRNSMDLISSSVARIGPKNFKGDGLIHDFAEYTLAKQYIDLENSEESAFKNLEKIIKAEPLWTDFLEKVRGCGPAMAGVILSEIDISKARYSSSIWKYAGLDVVMTETGGEGRSRRQNHLIDREYANKDGETATRKSITFNPWLKTKLIGVLGPCMIKAGGYYAEIYKGYKNRLENMPAHVEKSKGHRHAMAIRYMIKMFLIDLYAVWRALEGLPVEVPYSEGKLGIVHGGKAA